MTGSEVTPKPGSAQGVSSEDGARVTEKSASVPCGESALREHLDSVDVSLSIGIVGLPNVGKSTLFNALTKNEALAANYPFATIEPNVGVVGVPDHRLGTLAGIFSSAKVIPATVDFVDIAGIVRGASEGEGLGNQFLANIRESDAICQVIRAFEDPDVTHVDGDIQPSRDIETINTELILADLQTLDKALPRLEKDAKRNAKDKAAQEALATAREARRVLDEGVGLSVGAAPAGIDVSLLRELNLLTVKPFIYVFNLDTDELGDSALRAKLSELVAPSEAVFLDAKIEAELAELEEDEAAELLESMGQTESGLAQLARVGFATLGLQTFLTAGPKESRAWTIRKGATAPEAAGAIHTDFQRGFIKAEVVSYGDLVEAGTMQAARSAGKVRMEGKEYVMSDGDVVEFRFNV
ncbi:redox-regulated ATPase YchF [Streptomonospora arabica]